MSMIDGSHRRSSQVVDGKAFFLKLLFLFFAGKTALCCFYTDQIQIPSGWTIVQVINFELQLLCQSERMVMKLKERDTHTHTHTDTHTHTRYIDL